jgi:L-ascorbate metabolism protein UlaG (beta-lactamase superfamily)
VEPILIPTDGTDMFDDVGTVYFVGTATCLIRFAGITVLTDPNFLHRGEKVHLGYGLTATRRTEPALSIDQLPHVDVVVLSHLHEDHFDRVAEERLDKRIPIVTTRHASIALQRKGFLETYAPATWEAIEVQKGETRLNIAAMPGRHGPGLVQFAMPPVMGSVLDFSTSSKRYRIYVSGDTLPIQELRKIPERYPGIDLGLFHLGGTKVAGITVTMNGKMGVQALEMVDPNLAIPIHYDDYDRFKSPLDDFKREVERVGLVDRVRYLERGEVYSFAPRVRSQQEILRASRTSFLPDQRVSRVTLPMPT